MSKLNKLLHSWNEADTYLKKKIDIIDEKTKKTPFIKEYTDKMIISDSKIGKIVDWDKESLPYDITVCSRNLIVPYGDNWKASTSNVDLTVDNEEQSITITYSGSGNATPTTAKDTMNSDNWIDVRNLVGKSIYGYIDFISGTISNKWLGVRYIFKDISGNDVVIGSSIASYKNVQSNTIGFYELAPLEITQEMIDTGVVYVYANYWISSNNTHTNAKLKMMFALESGLTSIEKYKSQKFTITSETKPFAIDMYPPVTNIFAPSNITTFVPENELAESILDTRIFEKQVIKLEEYEKNYIAENIITFPYSNSTGDINGITWTVNDDGTIHAEGTATTKSYFFLANKRKDFFEENQVYTFSVETKGEGNIRSVYIGLNGSTTINYSHHPTANDYQFLTFTYNRQEGWTSDTIAIAIDVDETVDITFKVLIEKGTIPHKYQPYTLSRKSLLARIEALEAALSDSLESSE